MTKKCRNQFLAKTKLVKFMMNEVLESKLMKTPIPGKLRTSD